MAEKKGKKSSPPPKKGSGLTLKQRLRLILLIILLFAAGVLWLLHYMEIISVQDIMVKLGLADRPATRADLEVHFIDVGQGDCILVASQGQIMLIDSGERDNDNAIESYLIRHGIHHIDKLIATHPHSDHIGEMAEIMYTFDVDSFMMPRIPDAYVPTTKCYEDMLKAVDVRGVSVMSPKDTSFQLGCCQVQIFTSDIEDSDNLNNYSLIVKVVHDKNSFLFTGDCENEEEKSLLKKGVDLKAKVLKAAHHGSSTSSSADFLDVVDPEYAVISCGKNNDYGHPNKETVRRLSKYARNTDITARDGSVVFISDGEGLTVECERDKK